MRCVPQVSINDRDLRHHCCDRIVYMRTAQGRDRRVARRFKVGSIWCHERFIG